MANLRGTTELGQVSAYTAPTYDYGRLASLTQELASPNVRRLRSGLRESILSTSNIENPAARAMALRKSMEGYGQGVESAVAGARSGALSAYKEEYGAQSDAARLAWAEQAMRDRLQWQQDSADTEELRKKKAPIHTVQYLNHDPLASGRNNAPSSSGYWNLGYGGAADRAGAQQTSSFNTADPLGLLG